MTRKSDTIKDGAEVDARINEHVRLLYDHIKLVFIANVKAITESHKPETLLKMIQACKEIQPVDSSNEELWKTVQKVRQEVLGPKPGLAAKPKLARRRRVQP